MKRFVGVLALVALLAGNTVSAAGVCNRPVAARNGRCCGVNGAAIAAGVGVIVAVAAVAIITNNSHSH